MMLTARQISEMLNARITEFCAEFLPGGQKLGSEYRAGSVNGEEGQSLRVELSGDKIGLWHDFATQEGGDLLQLMALKRKTSLSEAIKHARVWLGIGSANFSPQSASKYVLPSLPKNCSELSGEGLAYLQSRGILESTISKFKIMSDRRNLMFPFYRDQVLVNYKYLAIDRIDGKKKLYCAQNAEPILFGWHAIKPNARKIIITEGEIDAMTWHQMGFDALSVPFGAKNTQWIESEYENLAQFDDIYISFDADEVGQEGAEALISRLGRHRCRLIKLPHKDANECLQKGLNKEDFQACFNAALMFDPVELKDASLYADQVIEEIYPVDGKVVGIYPPFEKLGDKVLFRPDELSIWTGINGHGKSQFLGQIILGAMKQKAKVCIASLELRPERLLMRLTLQASAVRKPTEQYIRAIHDWYKNKLFIFDLLGTAKADRLLEVFVYARQRYDVTMFVIDSLMKCGIDEEDYKTQKSFVEKLCDFKNEYKCHVHLVVHPRKGMDELRAPGKLDVKGTGAITDLADNCFTIWRNKKKEEEIQKLESVGAPIKQELLDDVDCIWSCDKQRNGDWEGKIGLWFDPNTYQYLERKFSKPKSFVEYSQLQREKVNEVVAS
jgi:twinkle protein